MNKIINKKKYILATAILMVFIIVPITIAFAKFFKTYASSIQDTRTIIADFYVDIVDANKKPVINKIGIDDLNPGDIKEVVFYVRNGSKDGGNNIISDVNLDYSISLLHTNNLPLSYELYKESVSSSNIIPSKATVNATASYINGATEIKFAADSNYLFTLDMANKDNDGITYDKYVLRVKWNQQENDSDYIKEIDFIYMIVNAIQKENKPK